MKNGQKNIMHISSFLCSRHKQTLHFFQKKSIPNLMKFTKTSNLRHSPGIYFSALAKTFIVFYQASFSYFLGGNCRYYPSCSHFAYEAFTKHKVLAALCIVSKRLLSCHPFSKKSFYDPVPFSPQKNDQRNQRNE